MLTGLTLTFQLPAISEPLRWELAEPGTPPSGDVRTPTLPAVPQASPKSAALNWEMVEPSNPVETEPSAAPDPLLAGQPTWELVLPGEEFSSADVAREVEAQEAAEREALPSWTPQPCKPPTAASAISSGASAGIPQLARSVPMGFGPSGLMGGVGFSGADCRTESRTCTQYANNFESFREVGEAVLDGYLGFGDSSKSIGVLITQTVGGTIRASQRGNIFERMQTGFALSRNLGPNTAIKLGAEGAIPWDQREYELAFQIEVPKSAFAVISHRIPLKKEVPTSFTDFEKDPVRWFPDLYLTAGLGNGVFRPSDAVIRSQIREVKKAGCWKAPCPNSRVKRALTRGTEWGTPYPIGALALAVTDQLNLITEWTGRNLNVSLSLQPFRDIGFTITPGIGNLVRNSDYNNGYPTDNRNCQDCDFGNAVTNRPIWYVRSMININF